MLTCPLCGESLDKVTEITNGFHVSPIYGNPIPVWDACIRAASGEPARLIRVFHAMALSEPLLARFYDGDR